MSARLTIVLDDDELYRQLKIKAAEDGVPMKELVERGIRLVVGRPVRASAERREFDWDEYETMLQRIDAADAEAGVEGSDLPDDLSDIKKHLYGRDARAGLRVAEEGAHYAAK